MHSKDNKIYDFIKARVDLIIVVVLFVLTLVIYYLSSNGFSPYNYFSRLADSFLKGQVYLDEGPSWLNELIPLKGKYYVVYPPMPAILLMPMNLIVGVDKSQTTLSILLGALNCALAYILFRQIFKSRHLAILLGILYSFGTNIWYLASVGSAWYIAHVVAATFTLLALIETFGKKRLFLIGLFIGAAFWARTTVLFTAPFFYIYLHKYFWPINKKTLTNFLLINGGIFLFIVADFWYNFVRFGNISPLAPYEFIPHAEKGKDFESGFLKINAIYKHLEAIFWRFPGTKDQFPYFIPSFYSMAIWITTPAVLFVLRFRKNILTVASWLAIIPTFLLISLWAGVGYTQFGYRFSQDFILFLIILIGLGIGKKPGILAYLLIVLSIIVNLWGVIMLNKYNMYVY